MRTALKQVTALFGQDAAILSNRKVAGGVEVIAALEYDESLVANVLNNQALNSSSNLISHERATPSNEINSSSVDGWSVGEKLTDTEDYLHNQQMNLNVNIKNEQNTNRMNTFQDHSDIVNNKQNNLPQLEWTLDPTLQAMKEELEMVRTMMSEQHKGNNWKRFAEKQPRRAMIARRLHRIGLDEKNISFILRAINNIDSFDNQDVECLWQNSIAVMAKTIAVQHQDNLMKYGGCYAFVGQTGVGKTTTIAKLAARFVIKHGADSVAIISTDAERLTAQEQLTTFGKLLDIPTATLSKNDSLELLIRSFGDKKLILIDTAGVNFNDSDSVEQIRKLNSCKVKINKVLLMSATSHKSILRQSLQSYSSLGLNGLVITRLDEAVTLGDVLNTVLQQDVPVYYTTNGQRIPEDIRVAKGHQLVAKGISLSASYHDAEISGKNGGHDAIFKQASNL